MVMYSEVYGKYCQHSATAMSVIREHETFLCAGATSMVMYSEVYGKYCQHSASAMSVIKEHETFLCTLISLSMDTHYWQGNECGKRTSIDL